MQAFYIPGLLSLSLTCSILSAQVIPSRPLKVNVDLALIPVNVLEHDTGKPFLGLVSGHFKLTYDGKPQPIKYFSQEDAPVSLGIVLDRSGSMGFKVDLAKELLKEFQAAANPADEIFLITFADTIDSTDFTSVQSELDSRILFVNSKGQTTLWDALYYGINKMKQAKYQRRALIVLTDGGDNHSRYTFNEVRSRVREADTQFYFIDLLDSRCVVPLNVNPCEQEVVRGPDYLSELSQASGGTGYIIQDIVDAKKAAVNIDIVIRQQYVLGFSPKGKTDGKWHKVKVKLQRLPKHIPILDIQSKEGVYAPES